MSRDIYLYNLQFSMFLHYLVCKVGVTGEEIRGHKEKALISLIIFMTLTD